MHTQEILEKLELNKDLRGIAHFEKLRPEGLRSFGMGLTKVKALAKPLKTNRELALSLWESEYLEAKYLALMIDDPKQVTQEQIENQFRSLSFWMLSHVWATSFMPKVPFAFELAKAWIRDKDWVKRRCGYLLLVNAAKTEGPENDAFFRKELKHIEKEIQQEENLVKDAMNNALLAIGCRNAELHAEALKVARAIGKVQVDYGDNSCEAIDCIKHLQSDRITQKLR